MQELLWAQVFLWLQVRYALYPQLEPEVASYGLEANIEGTLLPMAESAPPPPMPMEYAAASAADAIEDSAKRAPGVAMKSEPIEFAGRKMHMPGTLIGKALEPLEKGKGEMLVLLSLQ